MQSVGITGYTTFTFYKRFTSVLQFVLLRAWTVALNALPYNVSIILKDNFHVDKARAKPTTSAKIWRLDIVLQGIPTGQKSTSHSMVQISLLSKNERDRIND